MKRVLSSVALAVAVMALSACGNNPPPSGQGAGNNSAPSQFITR
jgi:predicted small lipoprotein YifL